MTARIDYYFSVLSDWAYFGGERLERLAARYGATICHKPIRLAEIYDRTGGIVLQQRSQQRQNYRVVELERWRDRLGITINLHPRHYPVDDALASCAILAVRDLGGDTGEYANRVLRAIWAEERDISDASTLTAIADGMGLDGKAVTARARGTELAGELQANTDEAVARGVFGSPFYLYAGQLFWGQDRLPFLEELLAAHSPRPVMARAPSMA